MPVDVSKFITRLPLEYQVNQALSEGVKTTKDINFGMKNLITKPVLGANDHAMNFKYHQKLMSNVEEKNQDVPQQE